MRCKVYRSLDKPNAFFGIRGAFITRFALYMAVAGGAGLMVGIVYGMLIGFIIIFAGGAAAYLYVTSLQAKLSHREFQMKQQSPKYTKYVVSPPYAFRHIWRKDRGLIE